MNLISIGDTAYIFPMDDAMKGSLGCLDLQVRGIITPLEVIDNEPFR
jgi:hypothetical protein